MAFLKDFKAFRRAVPNLKDRVHVEGNLAT